MRSNLTFGVVAALVFVWAQFYEVHGAYGDYSSTRPAWLDQSVTSANGNFMVWFSDNVHHDAPYLGVDGDGDGMPDAWEIHFLGSTAPSAAGNADGDPANNLAEFQAGSWPNDDYFRPEDTIPPAVNGAGQNIVVQDVIDTLLFCEGQYAAWGFNAPSGLPLGVFIRNTYAGGWGSVNPLWCSPYLVSELTNSDRRGVTIHELFHNVQLAYPEVPRDSNWFIEGSARMSQDFFYADLDANYACNYSGEITGFLADPEAQSLFERSYNAVFFWRYLCEQTGGAITGQPWGGFDALDHFMRSARGKEGTDSVQEHLNDLPVAHYWRAKEFSHFYGAWVTALYTRQFNAASLSPLYYYQDEQENLPASRLRPVNISNCPYHAGAGTYTPEAISANGSRFYGDADKTTWTQHLGKWRSRYYAFKPDPLSRFFMIWVDGKAGQRNYYATVGARGRDVTHLGYHFGEDRLQAIYCRNMDEVGVVVASLDNQADYDVMVWALTDFSLNIVYPLNAKKEMVRVVNGTPPAPIEVRLQVRTEKQGGPDGSIYVHGLTPDLFTVSIHGVAAAVLSGYEIGSEYWLVVQPPDLPVNHEYDLNVKLLDRQDTELKAVRYEDRPHMDRMIVIDRSGSMGSELMGNNEKMLAAKSGGRLYTDLMIPEDMLGLVSFGGDLDGVPDDAALHQGLATVTAAYQTTVKNSINTGITDDPSQYEHTALGQGVGKAYVELDTRATPEHDWSIALLTDGLEDVTPLWSDPSVSGVITLSKVKIDAIALGDGAHEVLLQQIAQDTEGEYYHVSIPTGPVLASSGAGIHPVIQNQVANIYRMINERETQSSRIWSQAGMMTAKDVQIPFQVYEGMRNLLLTVNWPSTHELKMQLQQPDGTTLSPQAVDKSHAIFSLPVLRGEWRLKLNAADAVPYLVILTGYGDLRSQLFFTEPDLSHTMGAIEKICYSLVTSKGPVANATVRAVVTTPSGKVSTWRLYDNGDHGDLTPNDGIYSRDYRLTPWAGSYQVTVIAEGELKDHYRIENTGFFLRTTDPEITDRDKDGLPDEWEARYGVNVGKNHAQDDLDGDGLNNLAEFYNGGNPADQDTDHGGTADGAEFKAGMNILDFEDDLIAPPTAFYANRQLVDAVNKEVVLPESGQNTLYWSRGTRFATLDLYRADTPAGPFVLIAHDWPADKRPYIDQGLTNGKFYYYKLAAMTTDGLRSRLTEAIEAIPKAHHVRPWGLLKIRSNPVVVDLTLELALQATPETKEMRLAHEASFAGSLWQPFQEKVAWKIAGAEGINYVFAQFRDSELNESLIASAAVEFQQDSDHDGLGDRDERLKYMTDPQNTDTDSDRLNDGDEILKYHTDPVNKDTDGDGFPDGIEVKLGTAPTNGASYPDNIAPLGIGILGTKGTLDRGSETPVFHVGSAQDLNDGDLTTHVDTWNGVGADTASFVGILWNQPVTQSIVRLELSLATFFDGGWFGVNGVGPGSGAALSAEKELIAPMLQVTRDGGATWKAAAFTSDYLRALDGHRLPAVDFGPPTLATAHFRLSEPPTGLNGLRLIGAEGGTASGGFLGVFELAVRVAKPVTPPLAVKLLNMQWVNGQLQFEFDTQAGITHELQFTTSLSPVDWRTLTTINGDGSRKQILDNPGDSTRFYRVTSHE